MKLRVLAPAKLNLCLFLGPVRADGRHELVTVFESLSLADELAISSSSVDEVLAPGIEGPNLVSQAVAGLRRLGWNAPPLRIEIDKRIPVAAGMGGGSADAAALLRVAAEIAPMDADDRAALAVSLGADVPSQLQPGVSLGTGAGEITAAAPSLVEHAVVLVPQPFPLSTADVYREADRLGLPRPAGELARLRDRVSRALAGQAGLPPELLVNDLEPAAVSLAPPVAEALDALCRAGAETVLVCGSGPTAAGILWGEAASERAGEVYGELRSRGLRAEVAHPVGSEFSQPSEL